MPKNLTPSHWREFAFICHELLRAIVPAIPLAEIRDQWPEIARGLAEPHRKRRPQLESAYHSMRSFLQPS